MPELKNQIETLRNAFSVDPTKPFELKESAVYGSPRRSDSEPSTPTEPGFIQEGIHAAVGHNYNTFPVSDNLHNGQIAGPQYDTPSAVMLNTPQTSFDGTGQMMPLTHASPEYDPSKIFE